MSTPAYTQPNAGSGSLDRARRHAGTLARSQAGTLTSAPEHVLAAHSCALSTRRAENKYRRKPPTFEQARALTRARPRALTPAGRTHPRTCARERTHAQAPTYASPHAYWHARADSRQTQGHVRTRSHTHWSALELSSVRLPSLPRRHTGSRQSTPISSR